jgi:hypothetical protein
MGVESKISWTDATWNRWRFAYLLGEMKIKTSTIIARDLVVTQKTVFYMLDTLKTAIRAQGKKLLNGSDVLDFENMTSVLEVLLAIKFLHLLPKRDPKAHEMQVEEENIQALNSDKRNEILDAEKYMAEKEEQRLKEADEKYKKLFYSVYKTEKT